MTDVRLRILPPWSTYVKKLEALFDGDPQIAFNVDLTSACPSVVIATNNPEKATALAKLLPDEKTFGNVTLNISIDCSTMSNREFANPKELYETAFEGNPAFAYVLSVDNGWFTPFTYVVFKNCVVQFFNDNLNDPHGVVSTLYQEIASEVFDDRDDQFYSYFKDDTYNGVVYCTDIETKLGKSFDEWIR